MASFKTGAYQKEIPVDVNVTALPTNGDETRIRVGDFVTLSAQTTVNGLLVYPMIKATTIAGATHILAQGDDTSSGFKQGHVPVELRNYTPNYGVTSTGVQKVALYKIIDTGDIIPDMDGLDYDHA